MSAVKASPDFQRVRAGAVKFPWGPILWFGVLLVVCYLPVLERLFHQWMDDPNVGHGVFVPLAAGYIAWQSRGELLARAAGPNWWGLAIVAYGSLQLMIGTLGAELFLQRTAFVISIVGAVLLFAGLRGTLVVAFPLFLLFLMIPIPAVIFNQITLPLQFIASDLAEGALTLLGVPVLREGNILELPSQTLSVVEACSGIRSLLSLSFLALIYAYFFDSATWMRAVLLAASVPIAIIANASRVTLTGLISEWDPELAKGFFHNVEGWVIFLVSLVLLVITHRLVRGVLSLARARK